MPGDIYIVSQPQDPHSKPYLFSMIFYVPKLVLGKHLHLLTMLSGWRSQPPAMGQFCPLDGAGWAESKVVQCGNAFEKPAFLLTAVGTLTSNHGSIAQGKCRLPVSCSWPRASPWGTGRGLLSQPASKWVPEVSPLAFADQGAAWGSTPLWQWDPTCLVTQLWLFW